MMNNLANSHGFEFILQNEQTLESMKFASSDYSDSTLHPSLKICFTVPDFTTEIKSSSINIYPNPFTNFFSVEMNSANQFSMRIIDLEGRVCEEYLPIKNNFSFGNNLHDGIYFIELTDESNHEVVSRKKIIKQ